MNPDTDEKTTLRWQRDGVLTSVWQEHIGYPFESQERRFANQIWDVAIVGGGITGLSTALRLQEAGKRCIVIEAHQIGFGTTGGTTAHINTMLDTPYHTIESDFGIESSRLVADAACAGRDLIARNVSAYQIACDFEYKEGVLFAQTDEEAAALKKIYEGSLRAGVDVAPVNEIPVPFSFRMAISYRMQAQIHPLKYLLAIAQAFKAAGGTVVQHTQVSGCQRHQDAHHLETPLGSIRANNIVYATHIPPGVNVLHFRCAPYRSYVLGAQLADEAYPGSLAYDMQEPYHYFRTHLLDGKPYLILGGADHKTGHGDPEISFRELEAYLHKYFDVTSVDYRWSAQFFEPADGLPYIGKLPGGDEGTYVATGFGGNGILFGSFSAVLLSDLILGIESPCEKLFSPLRVKPVAAFTNFVKENADVVYRFVADRLAIEKLEAMVELAPDTGAVVNYEDQRVALYKSPEGTLNALNPVCTHAGCLVAWNNAEKSWDCPCHGGRYDISGKVLTGPPRKDLEVIPLH
ncbi:FAD-dependent oxidoreductase [Parapedobacter sp.]